MLLRFHAYVLLILPSLARGARPAELDGIILDASAVRHSKRRRHDSDTSTRVIPACSVTNGTGQSSAYPCKCGHFATCQYTEKSDSEWCTAKSNRCLERVPALRAAMNKSDVHAAQSLHNFFKDSRARTVFLFFSGLVIQSSAEISLRTNLTEEMLPDAIDKFGNLSIPLIAEAFNDTVFTVRELVVKSVLPKAIGKLGAAMLPLLNAALHDSHLRQPAVEGALSEAVDKLGADIFPFLSKILDDSDGAVRRMVVKKTLPKFINQHGTLAESLVDKVAKDPNKSVRLAFGEMVLPQAIGKFGIGMMFPMIRRGLECDGSVEVCHAFADQLTKAIEQYGNASLQLLEVALQSEDQGVRKRAAGQPLLLVTKDKVLSENFDSAKWAKRMSNDLDASVKVAAGAALSVVAMEEEAKAQEELSQAKAAKREAELAQNESKAETANAKREREEAIKLVKSMEIQRIRSEVVEEKMKLELKSAQEARDNSLVESTKLKVETGKYEDKKEQAAWVKDKFFECLLALGAAAVPLVGTLVYWTWKAYHPTSDAPTRGTG